MSMLNVDRKSKTCICVVSFEALKITVKDESRRCYGLKVSQRLEKV